MEPIRSGTTTERLVRTAILAAMFVGYSSWSFRDGLSAYPRDNRDQLLQKIENAPKLPPDINPQVTKAATTALAARIKQEGSIPFDDITDQFGDDPVVRDTERYYFGPGGLASVTLSGARAIKVEWKDGPHKEGDLTMQLGMGFVTGLFGLIMVLQLARAALTRIELTDDGLKVTSQGGWRLGGSPLIPFDAMTGIRDPDDKFRDKKSDFVELDYKLDDGTEGSVRLNMYVHKACPSVIEEICRRKGFDNPLDRPEPDEEEPTDADEPAEESHSSE